MANRGTHHRVAKPPAMPPQPQPTIPPQGVIDPTANVLSLVAAAIQRQDDLRDIELNRADDMRDLTSKYEEKLAQVREKAQRDLAVAESRRIDAITLAESRRIDALLAAQANNVALASEKAATQAATLAAQVTANAEALRTQVAATAATTAQSIASLRDSLEKRLTVVEQNQYQAGGAQSQKTEGTKNIQWVITLIVGAVMASLGMGITILFFLLRGSH